GRAGFTGVSRGFPCIPLTAAAPWPPAPPLVGRVGEGGGERRLASPRDPDRTPGDPPAPGGAPGGPAPAAELPRPLGFISFIYLGVGGETHPRGETERKPPGAR